MLSEEECLCEARRFGSQLVAQNGLYSCLLALGLRLAQIQTQDCELKVKSSGLRGGGAIFCSAITLFWAANAFMSAADESFG